MSKRLLIQKPLEFTVEAISIIFANLWAYILFHFVVYKILDYPSGSWIGYATSLAISYIIVFLCFFSPLNLVKRSKPMEFAATTRNCVLTYMLLAVLLLLTKNDIIQSRYLFLGSFSLYFIFSLFSRYVLKRFLLSYFSKSKAAEMVGVITNTKRAENFISNLKYDWSKNVKAVALTDTVLENGVYKKIITEEDAGNSSVKIIEKETINEVCGVPVIANSDNIMGWIRTASLDIVYINIDSEAVEGMVPVIEELEDMGITVNVNIPALEAMVENSKFNNLNCVISEGYPMAVFSPTVHSFTSLFIKRMIDLVGGIFGSIISLPIILLTAIPLLIESPGPLIFKQPRVGKNGRVFNIYKLRSMYTDAEERKKDLMKNNKMDGHMFKMDNDPRITKVGKIIRKLSIDELPQFWNVVKGEMSLVGTRPPTVDEFEMYESHHKRRLSMSPGITGMWQVSGRSDIQDFEEVVKLDCEYIDNWSLWLDIKILFKTIGVVLLHKGAE